MPLVSEGANFRGPLGTAGPAEPSLATVGDYIALMKPRVMSLVVFTALVGLAVAPGHLHPVTGFTALLCIAVGGGRRRCAEYVVRRGYRCGHDQNRTPSCADGPRAAR
jgi:hypothetical protein